jgi:ABC-2 type transport system ATP-binding protein
VSATQAQHVQATHRPTDSIIVEHVSKKFTMRYHRTIKQMSVAKLRGHDISNTFLALDDVSFTVQQGESIGLMGLNGSGKSTLLKLINGVLKPDGGRVLTRGRIAGLIATGAGFHPQLTGRENIYLNAAILGMTEAETTKKFDAIVEFADIGRFIDTPVGHYSSGMFSRLGFAVAVHTDSDIFLVDEVLAVGDKPFKKKCIARMEEIKAEGRTLFYVSHAAGSVRRMCERVLVLEKGVLAFDGPADDGIRYLKYDDDDNDEGELDDLDEGDDDSDLGADI